MILLPDDMATILRLQNERATEYCETCGGSGRVRVCVTGSKLDFVRCETCKGTGQPKVFKNRKNREYLKYDYLQQKILPPPAGKKSRVKP